MRRQVPIGVLISGSGTNLQSIIDAIEAQQLDAKIQVVLSNRADAYGLVCAKNTGFPSRSWITKGSLVERPLIRRWSIFCEPVKWNWLCLPVYAAPVPRIRECLFQPIMNIHPALLPAFPGLHVQKKPGARRAVLRLHGSLCQRRAATRGRSSFKRWFRCFRTIQRSLSPRRILKQEHRIYPRAIQLYSEGRLRVEGRKVFVDDLTKEENQVLVQPPLKR